MFTNNFNAPPFLERTNTFEVTLNPLDNRFLLLIAVDTVILGIVK